MVLCLMLLLSACSAQSSTVGSVFGSPKETEYSALPSGNTVELLASPTPTIIEPMHTPPRRYPSSRPAVVITATPRLTYVPLPPSTPDPNAVDASPTPPWATPYPSPVGEPTVKTEATIELATIENCSEYVFVRSGGSTSSDVIGTAALGTSYRVLSDGNEWTQILFNGNVGFVKSDYVSARSVDCQQQSDLSYSLCSLNVHNMGNGSRVDELANVIQLQGVDVVCIQEVDLGTRRVEGANCTELLAKALGYPYWSFSAATGYEGGYFGTAIISRYPIVDAATFKLDVATGMERRSLGYARILLDGGTVNVFNTHLCPSSMCYKSINLASLQYELRATGIETYTVSGDFNCSPPRIDDYLPDIYYVNIDKSTFGDGSVPKILDNILYTDGIIPSAFEIVDTRTTNITDHDMVYCLITVLKP